LKGYDLGLSEEQMYEFVCSTDKDKNGFIDYEEFIGRFKTAWSEHVPKKAIEEEAEQEKKFAGHEITVSEKKSDKKEKRKSSDKEESKKTETEKPEDPEWFPKTMKKIADQLWVTHQKNLAKAFSEIDKNKDGVISYPEFSTLLQRDIEGLDLTQSQRRQLWKYIDKDKLDHITKQQFMDKFSISDQCEDDWSPAIVKKAFDTIRKHKVRLSSTFRKIDKDSKKSVNFDQFKAVLEGMNVLLDCPMSNFQIKKLFSVVDINGDGVVQYSEFLSYFQVTDTEPPRIIEIAPLDFDDD